MSKQDAEYLAYAKIRKGLQNDCLKDNRFGAFFDAFKSSCID